MKKILSKVNQTGTMLVEAMAMLGLIAMVTPILYKKAAERTTELQDINASNQLRALANAMDAYIKDNFGRITRGETVTTNCNPGVVNFGAFAAGTADTATFPISHLCEYLPYGFLTAGGQVQDTKMFDSNIAGSYQVVLKLEQNVEDGRVRAQTVTGFLTAVPRNPDAIGPTRASRIATMVGSNGGFVTGTEAMGAQGIWSIDNIGAELGLNLPDNSFVISSIQPISSQGLANEDVLHRKNEPDNDDMLNTMETDLFMGYVENDTRNIRLVNQIIMAPTVDRMAGNPEAAGGDLISENSKGLPGDTANSQYAPDLKYTLYIGRGGGAYIEGVLNAMDSIFSVDETGISYHATTSVTDDGGVTTDGVKGDKVFNVTADFLEYGNIVGKDGGGNTANTLLRVTHSTFDFGTADSTTGDTDGEGNPIVIEGANVIHGDKDMMSAGNNIFKVVSPSSESGSAVPSGEKWSEGSGNWSTVIGRGSPYLGGYTEYDHTTSGVTNQVDVAERAFALTVNGPVFVRDTLQTGKLKAVDIDGATIRGGVDPANFYAAKEDGDFYSLTHENSFIVGKLRDFMVGESDRNSYPRLQIIDSLDNPLSRSENPDSGALGIVMRHDQGVDIRSGTWVSHAINADGQEPPAIVDGRTAPEEGVIRLMAAQEISLVAEGGTQPNPDILGTVSIQRDMLRAYEDANDGFATIDSVVQKYNIVNHRELTPYDIAYYERDSNESRVLLGNTGFYVQAVDGAVGKAVVNITPELGSDIVSSKFTGGFAIYDHDIEFHLSHQGYEISDSYPEGMPAVYASKGTFEIRATKDFVNVGGGAYAKVEAGEKIFQVDNWLNEEYVADDDTRGSVYVRKGAINLATNLEVGTGIDGESRERLTNHRMQESYKPSAWFAEPIGYVAADRFVSHVLPTGGALDATHRATGPGYSETVNVYDMFEVNPAYTSVMHDIKLTTRGGARLSDILPDFINKGIYVVDNTYNVLTPWTSGGFIAYNSSSYDLGGSATAETEVSAYLGFVPTPQCPPGYAKVMTINPSGWAMAQAGTPGPGFSNPNGFDDIFQHTDPYLYYFADRARTIPRDQMETVSMPPALTFQKNTWLKAMVLPYCDGFAYEGTCTNPGNFRGWGAVMGFIYPQNYFQALISAATGSVPTTGDGGGTVYWNLFPVYHRQLEAYATVYCYFDRAQGGFDENYVDTEYDQLNTATRRHFSDKWPATNRGRLNDPALKYDDPW